jgi:zona occludens toxin (predicted ATPase)
MTRSLFLQAKVSRLATFLALGMTCAAPMSAYAVSQLSGPQIENTRRVVTGVRGLFTQMARDSVPADVPLAASCDCDTDQADTAAHGDRGA